MTNCTIVRKLIVKWPILRQNYWSNKIHPSKMTVVWDFTEKRAMFVLMHLERVVYNIHVNALALSMAL